MIFAVSGVLGFLYPLIAIRVVLSIQNLIFLLMYAIESQYFSPLRFDNRVANLLWNLMHSGLSPPVVENTRGVKVPCSTWTTL